MQTMILCKKSLIRGYFYCCVCHMNPVCMGGEGDGRCMLLSNLI